MGNPTSDIPIPRKLCVDVNQPEYRPDTGRVGVRLNGAEHNDIYKYDLDEGLVWFVKDRKKAIPFIHIEPYWRYPESRQMRRARERWESKRGISHAEASSPE